MKRRKSLVALLICLVAALFACGIFTLLNKHKGEEVITVEAAAGVASVDGVDSYGTINAALSAAMSKGTATITLLDNASTATPLIIEKDKNITLDLNGYILAFTGTNRSVITNNGNLTLNDSNPDKENIITSAVTGLPVTVYGGVITGGNFVCGGGIYVAAGHLTMNGGNISGNTDTANGGGGVCLERGTSFIMNGGTISHNKSQTFGGGVSTIDSTEFTMKGGAIKNNAAGKWASAIYADGIITISGGEIINNLCNETTVNSSAVYIISSDFTLSGKVIISGNETATDSGENVPSDLTIAVGTVVLKVGELKEGTSIGLKKFYQYKNSEFTSGYKANNGDTLPTKYFFSDEGCCILLQGDEVALSTEKHKVGDWIIDTEASCYSDGLKHKECSVCKLVTEKEVISASESHDYKATVTDPTCTEDGYTTYVCSKCGDTYTDNIISSPGHTLTKVEAVPATCTTTGKKEHYKCSSCGKLFADDTATVEWSESDIVTEVDTTNHDFATTYSKDESNHWYECSRCKEKKDEAAHTWDSGTETKAADCVNPGTKEYTCTVCGQNKTETISALGHNYEAVDGGTPPTCTTPGSGKVKCSRCGDVKEGDSIPALGHDYTTAWSKDETNHWHECTRDPSHPKDSLAPHDWDGGKVTSEPTATAKGVKTFTCNTCGQTRTEEFAAGENKITAFNPAGWTYGDTPATHTATATFGTPTITYSDSVDGTYVATKPTNAGTYWVKAEVEADPDGLFPAAVEKKSFTIAKRNITVTINAASSEEGQELEALTATVTSGTLAAGDSNVYALSTTANKDSINSYPITGTCLNDNYNITFVNGVYIVSKRAEDPNGGGAIDMPTDANVEFKVTQSKTGGDYSQLDGMKVGYWAQLWNRNDDGTLGDEYTNSLNCVLTLKIPTEIIEAIRGGEEINRDKIAEGLGVYYVTDGGMEKVNAFAIAQREDESWIIKFNYNSKFRAEVVFNAENYEEPAEEREKSGIPWWVWLIVGIGGATLITIIIVAVVLAKKKSAAGNAPAPAPTPVKEYDDAELKAQLTKQNKRIEDLENRDDGGFNDVYRGE